jgi:hypothetical protein
MVLAAPAPTAADLVLLRLLLLVLMVVAVLTAARWGGV